MVFFLIWVGIFRAKLGASPQARAHVAKDILHAERGVRGTFYTASAYGKCTHRVPEKTKADSWSERSRDLSEVLAEKYTVVLYCIVTGEPSMQNRYSSFPTRHPFTSFSPSSSVNPNLLESASTTVRVHRGKRRRKTEGDINLFLLHFLYYVRTAYTPAGRVHASGLSGGKGRMRLFK